MDLLDRYARWLEEEAATAGGIGPHEVDRIELRHIADSLAFAGGWITPPATALDIGSGVGLPGIPLAIAFPSVSFTLLDRSGRRTELAQRALRVLGIENASVVQAEISRHSGLYDAILMRAALRPGAVGEEISRLLRVDGVAVIGLGAAQVEAESGEIRSMLADHGLIADQIEVPVLDSPRSLLRITHA